MIPGIVVSIDPGNNYGWATWLDGKLVGSGNGKVGKFTSIWLPGLYADLVIIETPYFYPGDRPGQANSLIKLAYTAGQLSLKVPLCVPNGRIETVKPSQWKGSVPKIIHQKRIITELEQYGHAAPVRATSDEIDAIGIGLWAQKNLKVKNG